MSTLSGFDLKGWPAENTAFAIKDIDIVVEEGDVPELSRHEAEIDANWRAETAANPHLFNGRLITLHAVSLEDGVVRARGKIIPYAYHLWWRRQSVPPPTCHSFAMAVIVSSDNEIIAIRMSQTTANAGKVYCASGSLEEDDILDGKIDIDANMAREVAEETGLRLSEFSAGPDYFCAHARQCIMFYRFFRSTLDSSALIGLIQDHMRHDEEKEIDAAVAITASNRNRFNYAISMPPVLDLHFNKFLNS